ncbi:MAG: hypothetical protein A2W90_17820 [Bacteroidetes bacterium GWF2_42_66]|nr:MAG: hypothetical protein A2W92_13090 [Bacteroidetes bacterium GWA2_42_15]OFX98112.1 MAG: hypothetical protein A2W89_09310 [Bacteroidetes bacterium GWE2_42_39]OFY42496.1 MAG: hypothetical protein A2W90_17820 [Bacteroidetes bacterium GWF2_42_66]
MGFILALSGCVEVTTYPVPPDEVKFDTYELSVNSKPVDIYTCRVSKFPINQVWPGYQRPIDQTELAGFAYWDMQESVKVEISAKERVEKVIIRPLSLGIEPVIKDNKISFTLDRITPVIIEVNGCHHALHLFPNPEIKDISESKSSHMHYFGAGVHDIGRLQLQDNDTVYIAGGTVVYGYITAVNARNIHIHGRGVLDGSRIPRSNLPYIGPGCITLFGCSNISIDGVILRDPNRWCLNLFGCRDANISNVKLIGLWRYNSDGINVSNSQNVCVDNCFVRTYDDALEVKGVKAWEAKPVQNVRFNKCIVWCDWGRSMGVTYETRAPYIKDVTFQDCSIIRSTSSVMAITHAGKAAISNISFRNINVELDEWIPRPKLQKFEGEKYTCNMEDKYCPSLFSIKIEKNTLEDDHQGNIDTILFENIKLYGNTNTHSSLQGLNSKQNISNVTIKNLRYNDELVTDLKEANLTIGPFVEGVKLKTNHEINKP